MQEPLVMEPLLLISSVLVAVVVDGSIVKSEEGEVVPMPTLPVKYELVAPNCWKDEPITKVSSVFSVLAAERYKFVSVAAEPLPHSIKPSALYMARAKDSPFT